MNITRTEVMVDLGLIGLLAQLASKYALNSKEEVHGNDSPKFISASIIPQKVTNNSPMNYSRDSN